MRLLPLFILLTLSLLARAEDWTTTDGKTYKEIKVVSHDAAYVSILYADGGATIPLRLLNPDLQAKFGYDAVKAKAAEQAAAAQDQAQQQAVAAAQAKQLQQQKEQLDAQKQVLNKIRSDAVTRSQIRNPAPTVAGDREQLATLQKQLTDEQDQYKAALQANRPKPEVDALGAACLSTRDKLYALQTQMHQLQAKSTASMFIESTNTIVNPGIGSMDDDVLKK